MEPRHRLTMENTPPRFNDGYIRCYDLNTGQALWKSESVNWPWGSWGGEATASAYGLLIDGGYDGVHGIDWTTGKVMWTFEAPTPYQYETPYTANGTSVYPFFSGMQVADGMVYAYNLEHSPSAPLTRGWGTFCINATTGVGIWNITGAMVPGLIADGYLTASSWYDGYMYVFGKGTSATTVTATPEVSQVLIQGTVVDQSPGTVASSLSPVGAANPPLKNNVGLQIVPCVSDASMKTYMEYLYMQTPIPDGYMVTGVPVQLYATDQSGTIVNIGTVQSDLTGFRTAWAPPSSGLWTITATFAGDGSYGSSYSATSTIYNATSSNTQPSVTTQVVDTTPILYAVIGVGVAIIVAVALAVLILRKR